MEDVKYYSQEGLDALKRELNQLESVERPKISQAIAEARDKGDLSENAEYDAAKEAQGLLELKIAKKAIPSSNSPLIIKWKWLLIRAKARISIRNSFERMPIQFMAILRSSSS